MRTQQDNIPTERLPHQMALDAHGRVLRRPYFLLRAEHDQLMLHQREQASAALLAERREAIKQFADEVTRHREEINRLDHQWSDAIITELKGLPKVYCRPRLLWLAKKFISIR